MGLSQLGAGQPVNMSPAYQALQQRQQQAQLRKVMEQPGLMDGFSPQQRAILATMPESMAVELIMQRAFAPPPDPTRGVEINGQLVNPITGELMGITGRLTRHPIKCPSSLASKPPLLG